MAEAITVTPVTLLSLAWGIFLVMLGVIAYFLRSLHADFREVEKSLPDKYVRKEDFHRSLDELKAMLQRIFDKLDTKQDKGD